MFVPNTAADEAEGQGGSHLVTEAEALCTALCDMGVTPAVNLESEALYIRVFHDSTPTLGAIALLKLSHDRAFQEKDFSEDMITAVSHLGEFLAPAPAISSNLKTAPANAVIQALAEAGMLIRHHYERNDPQVPMLSFMPLPGEHVAPNAHMLMVLAVNRFHKEPEFAAAILRLVVDAGRSQHNA